MSQAKGLVRESKGSDVENTKKGSDVPAMSKTRATQEKKLCEAKLKRCEEGLELALERAVAGEGNVNHKALIDLQAYYQDRLNRALRVLAEAKRRAATGPRKGGSRGLAAFGL